MNPRVLRRFIILLAGLTFVAFTAWVIHGYLNPIPGDFQVRRGDIHLGVGEWDEALEDFNLALEEQPDHRGALMGRAIVFVQTGRDTEAEAELTYLINYLNANLEPDDPTGAGTLAAAHANLGILYDRQARYEDAVAHYIKALEIDEGAVDGPDIFHKILYEAQPSTIRDRAIYILEQLKLPEDQRLLRLPEKDERQRMYKP
ncbi:MAG: tetratricopeptide repeat protein [Alphaproteobacteria bacterium]|nr:tetratricopeptide repeat protein [Alphaproteobacteria bacterium]